MERDNIWEEPSDDFFESIEKDAQVITETEKDKEDKNKQKENTSSEAQEENLFDTIKQENEEEVDNTQTQNQEVDFEVLVEERVEELLNDLPDAIKELNKYVLNGGDWREILSVMNKSVTELDLDIEKEHNQELLLRKILKEEGNDEEEIETQIEYLKETGKLKAIAVKKYNKIEEQKKEDAQNLLKQQELLAKQEKENIKLAKEKAKTFLEKNEIKGLDITVKDKSEIPSYVLDKTVKLKNGTYITPLQYELFYELPKNEAAFLQLAVLIRNRNTDGTFNFSNIERKIRTELTKELKDNIRNTKTTSTSAVSGNSKTGKSLAEIFKI